MNAPNHVPLKSEVEKFYGKKVVTYTDCLSLSKEITLRTGFRLNVNTLRRFFGLVRAPYPPSLTTLDILARYCGFKSFEHFTAFLTSEPSSEPAGSPLLDYLDTLFGKAALTTYTDPTWIGIVRETILFLEKYPQLLDSFQRSAAKTAIGREIYFERFVNIDQLNGYYGRGLRYYLAEKSTVEGHLFAHALLVLRYYLTNDPTALERHYYELMNHPVNERVHPFVCARYFSARLFFHQGRPTDVFKVVSAARSFFKSLVAARDGYQSFPFFELVMADALVLTQQPLEALFYLQEARKKKNEYAPPAVDVHLFSPLDLYEAAAYAMLGDEGRAKKLLKKVNPTGFYFLSRSYHNIIFLLVEAVLFPAKAKTNLLQADDLIRQTGFQRLATIFEREELVNKKEQHARIYL